MSTPSPRPLRASLPSRIPSERPGQHGGKRDLNRRLRTQSLLDGSLELFLTHGLEAVTIDELAKAGGVAKGSFYRYFDSKADVVRVIYEPLLTRLERIFSTCEAALKDAHNPDQLFAAYGGLGEDLANMLMEVPKLVRLYLQESRGPATETRAPISALSQLVSKRAVELTQIARQHGMLRDIHPQVSALTVIGSVERIVQAFLNGDLQPSAEVVIHDLVSLVLDGLRTEKDTPTHT